MNIKRIKVTDRIHLLVFDTERDAASTLLRFEESYESPEFRGKSFSLEEFREWYIKNSPKNQGQQDFTYYSDWTAFNVPSYVLQPFFAGKFDPLSSAEEKVLEIFKNEPEPFYMIGVHKETRGLRSVLNHEIAHGLFHINKDYNKAVIELLGRFNVGPIKEKLHSGGGYHAETLDDEVQALIIEGDGDYRDLIPVMLSRDFKKLYNQYLRANGVSLSALSREIMSK